MIMNYFSIMSRFTCHMSPVTCNLSPVSCHMSYVTCMLFFLFFYFFLCGQSGEASQRRVCYQQGLRGLARYSVHSTATALQKILHHFLYMLDPHHSCPASL